MATKTLELPFEQNTTQKTDSTSDTTQTSNQTGQQNTNQTGFSATTGGVYQPFFDTLAAEALKGLGNTPVGSYTGRFAAEPNQMQHSAVDQLLAFAPQSGVGSQQVRQLALDTLSGKYLNPESNPYIAQAVQAAINPVTMQLNRQILPGLKDQFQSLGAYGGSRQGVSEGVAAGDWAAKSGDIASQIYYQNYEAERQRQERAAGLLDAANALGIQPAMLTKEAGDTTMDWENQLIQGGQAAYAHAQNDPWVGIRNYANILSGLTPFTTTARTETGSGTTSGSATGTSNTTGTTNMTGTNSGFQTQINPSSGGGIGGLFSGALGGASAGAAFGPWGAGIGGVLGGLGGLFK